MAADPEATTQAQDSTAAYIRGLVAQHRVSYAQTHVKPPADDAIESDEIECLLFALHRAGHLDLRELILLQVEYLREAKP